MSGLRALAAVLSVAALLSSAVARADEVEGGRRDVEPTARASDELDLMNWLARRGQHDLGDERWNAYGQLTWISSFKLPFHAPYTDANGSPNSLSPAFEHSYTGSATLYLGARLWPGAEAYAAPELIMEKPLSGLHGLGGAIQNFELQKQGSPSGVLYLSRIYLRQTVELGGVREPRESDLLQLGRSVSTRRLELTVGNFSVIDTFDKNSYASDLRRQFFNMAFMTYAAFDFAADARGYTWGAQAELRWDAWALRVAHVIVPKNPNDLALDFHFWRHFGDQLELEHAHTVFGRAGAVRLLGYRNDENMGRFDDALAAYRADPSQNAAACTGYNYGSANAQAPDLCWVRRRNTKVGLGLNLEQALTDDVGLFFRGMVSDGQTEVYAYTSTDRSLSAGALARGARWHRPRDYAGVGGGLGWLSPAHADYLRAGGIDAFIGDGKLAAAAESVVEAFYGLNLGSAIWLSADGQWIANPAFNADRGPVTILGARLHAEL